MDVELRNLSVAFDGRPVLTGLCHAFRDGSITCVTGPSGCGKTTLLRLLMGLLQPDSGQISGLPDRCAAVFQEDRLIAHLPPSANVRVALPRGFSRRRVSDALVAVGLDASAERPVRELSGGMRRRVAIVRALLADAPLVIMDEPFKGLDASTRDVVIRFVRPLLADRTVVITTHDPYEAVLLGGELFPLDKNG